MAKTEKSLVLIASTEEIASVFGISTRQITNWKKAGCPNAGYGRWIVRDVVAWWSENINSDRGPASGPESDSLNEAKRLYWHAKAENERLKADQTRGELYKASEVVESWVARITELTSGLETLAHRLPPLLVGKDRTSIAKIIQNEVWRMRDMYSRKGTHCNANK